MMRFGVRLILSAMAFALLAGFSPTARADDLVPVKVALHWNAPIAAFIPYYAAIDRGFYEQEGLKVDLLPLSGSSTVVTAVSTGDAQFGQAGAETILAGIGKGADIEAIFLLYQTNPNGLIVTKKSGIKSITDMRGKTVASSIYGAESKMLNATLRGAGMKPEDLNILNVTPGAKLTMMLTGQADATSGQANFQYIQAEMQGAEVTFLPFSTPEQPLFGHSIIVNSKWVGDHQDVATRFVRATVRGLVWAHDNVDQAVDLVAKWDTTLKVDRDFVKRDWEIQLKDLISGGLAAKEGIGHMDENGWNTLAQVLGEKIEGKQIFTNQFIPNDAPKW